MHIIAERHMVYTWWCLQVTGGFSSKSNSFVPLDSDKQLQQPQNCWPPYQSFSRKTTNFYYRYRQTIHSPNWFYDVSSALWPAWTHALTLCAAPSQTYCNNFHLCTRVTVFGQTIVQKNFFLILRMDNVFRIRCKLTWELTKIIIKIALKKVKIVTGALELDDFYFW